MSKIHTTREAWLTAAVELMRGQIDHEIMVMGSPSIAFPDMDQRVGGSDEPLPCMPANLRVACSNPSGGIRNRVRGECVYPQSSADASFEIWISPKMDDAPTVLLVLMHELMHATLHSWAPGAGHGPRFARLAKPLGLARPLTSATIATGPDGTKLRGHISRWAGQLGDYPHAGVDFAAHDSQRRRQSTRMLKAECLTDGCGFKVRMTRTWAAQATPLCPVCEGLGVHSRTTVVMAEGFELCQLAGVPVSRTGEDDAGAVERAALLRAERDERARQARAAAEEATRQAREAAEAAARVARREAAAREAAAAEAQAQRTANARAAGLGEAADLGVVEGQGVQNRYGASAATRTRRAAERTALPSPAFEGVAAGTATLRHLMELALPGCTTDTAAHDMNAVEDTVRGYCGTHQLRAPGRFALAEARRAGVLAAPAAAQRSVRASRLDLDDVPAPSRRARAPARSARFAGLDLD